MTTSPVVSLTDELIAELEQLYIAGWEESREGWNAEYPGDAHETRNFTDRMRKACEPVHKAILAEREELKRDAARYRWLMRQLGAGVSQIVLGSPVFSDEDVANAIDAAMQS